VNEFEALPGGYAKVIQPMRPYTDAEEWALNRSMELYGFIGTIIYDQYGRILDGHHRQRVARLRGLGAPFKHGQHLLYTGGESPRLAQRHRVPDP
jgi:hypothetical protein